MFKKIILALLVAMFLFVVIARRVSSVMHVEHAFHAPVLKVWEAWTTPDSMKNWWGPHGYSAPVIQSDFKAGGAYLWSMKSPKGEVFWNTGKFIEIIPQRKILMTHSFADEKGNRLTGSAIPVPGVWPDEITILVEFREEQGKTTVTVDEEGIPLIMKLFAKMGWEQQMEKIESLLK